VKAKAATQEPISCFLVPKNAVFTFSPKPKVFTILYAPETWRAILSVHELALYPAGLIIISKSNDLDRKVTHGFYMELQAATRPQPL